MQHTLKIKLQAYAMPLLLVMFFAIAGCVGGAATCFGVLQDEEMLNLFISVDINIAFSLVISLTSCFVFCALAYIASKKILGIIPLCICITMKSAQTAFAFCAVLRFVTAYNRIVLLLVGLVLPNAVLICGLGQVALLSTLEWTDKLKKNPSVGNSIDVYHAYITVAIGIFIEGIIVPLLLRVLLK